MSFLAKMDTFQQNRKAIQSGKAPIFNAFKAVWLKYYFYGVSPLVNSAIFHVKGGRRSSGRKAVEILTALPPKIYNQTIQRLNSILL